MISALAFLTGISLFFQVVPAFEILVALLLVASAGRARWIGAWIFPGLALALLAAVHIANGLPLNTRGRLALLYLPIVVFTLTEVRILRFFSRGLIAGGVFSLAAVPVVILAGRPELVLQGGFGELQGFNIEPNIMGPSLLLGLIILRFDRDLGLSVVTRMAIGSAMVVALVLTGSRLSIALAPLILLFGHQRRLFIAGVVAVAGLGAVLLLLNVDWVAANYQVLGLREYDLARFGRYLYFLDLLGSNPLGVGLDNYPIFTDRFWRPHNTLLSLGLAFGWGAVLLMVYWLWRVLGRLYRSRSSIDVYLLPFLSFALVGLFVDMVTWRIFWVALAFSFVGVRLRERQEFVL